MKPNLVAVDDEPHVLTAIMDQFEREFDVHLAASGSAALAIIAQLKEVSVLLSDQRMPGMTGDELFARAATISDATRVMITGFADLEAVIRAVNKGRIFGYVTKPWEEQGMRMLIHRAAEHHRLSRELHHERDLLRNLMQYAPDEIYFKDLDHRYIRINVAAARAQGISTPETAIGRLDAEFTADRAYLDAVHAEDRQVAETGKSLIVDEHRRMPDGTWYWVSKIKAPVLDERGQVTSIVGIARDITERKRAEEKSRRQLEHMSLLDEITRSAGQRLDLKSIFQIVLERVEESLPVDFGCVCLHDPVVNRLLVTCVGTRSDALAGQLGLLEDQASIDVDANGLGHCIEGRLVYEPDLRAVRNPFPERLAGGGLGSLVLAPLVSEGQVFGVLMVARREAHAFSSAECEFLRQLSAHVTLAARHAQLYGSLQQAYDDLRQTQAAAMQEARLRALGQMASGIAHDINNALSPVSLYVESMLETERALSERSRGYLETIQRAVEDVSKTVARLREFYRQRERQVELEPVQVNDLVRQVIDLTRARWNDMPLSRGIVIRVVSELAPDLPQVLGVESEIREAFTNLVFNAVDAMPEGGMLTLRTRLVRAGGQQPALAVEVADTGVGMDEETRRRCMEPFFTTKGERGTGLGLAMVFGMVQRHSAELEIDSAVGVGTTVRLLLDVPAAVGADPAEPGAVPAVPSRLRLLLIDDDPILLRSLREALETDGHVIVTASGGEAGIAAFRAALECGEAFAAVMTDLGMPYVDGRRVSSAVKEASPATPVILLTGWGQRMVADDDIPAHVDRVLAKPPKLRDLRAALAQLCGALPER